MATEKKLVKYNWGYHMTFNDEKLLNIAPVSKYKLASGAREYTPEGNLKFRPSEIVGNSYFYIYFQESLSKN